MNIQVIVPTDEIKSLWEEHMKEKWEIYAPATHFVQYGENGNIIAGFAVYYDDSDGVKGHYISGWSARHNLSSVIDTIKHLANRLGEIYIKTDKRQMKIIAYKIGDLVKNVGSFSYFIVRGNDYGKTEKC